MAYRTYVPMRTGHYSSRRARAASSHRSPHGGRERYGAQPRLLQTRPRAHRMSSVRWAPLGVARQAVIRDRLPRSGVGDELAGARTDAGVLIEDADPHSDLLRILAIAREDR